MAYRGLYNDKVDGDVNSKTATSKDRYHGVKYRTDSVLETQGWRIQDNI